MSATISPNAAPYTALITSEHNQKPNFMALVGVLTGAMGDATAAIQNIVPAFDLYSAVGSQLDILGLWIGQSRIIPDVLVTGYFGFSELDSGLPDGLQLVFGELSNHSIGGEFYNLVNASSGTTTLNDAQYLTVLLARIARNQSSGTLSSLEDGLDFIFGVQCAVIDNGTLELIIHLPVPITPTDLALITTLDILPRPAGVQILGVTYVPISFQPAMDSSADIEQFMTDGSEDDISCWHNF